MKPNTDPHEIADYLVEKHGLDLALDKATEGTHDANQQGDNYRLSIWREVKQILREHSDV